MTIPDQIRQAVIAHAVFCEPEEACGLLAVDESGNLRMAYCLTNSERSGIAFTIDPDEHFGSIRHADRNGWSIGGVFHSHPRSAPVPSRTDIAGALDPGWLHLIVGLGGEEPAVRAWRINDGHAREVDIEREVVPSL